MTGRAFKLLSVDVRADAHERELLFKAMARHGLSWEQVRSRVQAAAVDAAHRTIVALSGVDCETVGAPGMGAPALEGETRRPVPLGPGDGAVGPDAVWYWACTCGEHVDWGSVRCPVCGRRRPDLEQS